MTINRLLAQKAEPIVPIGWLLCRFCMIFLGVLPFAPGCSQLSSPPAADQNVVVSLPREADAAEQKVVSDDLPAVSELLLRRKELCAIDVDNRLRLLNLYRGYFIETNEALDLAPGRSERDHKLDALMLSSCNPARTPGVLQEMLFSVRSEEQWPAEYRELFNIIAAQRRAYELMETHNRELHSTNESLRRQLDTLRKEYQALEIEHRETIRGISEIERRIE